MRAGTATLVALRMSGLDHTESDGGLLARVAHRDEDALAQLYDRYGSLALTLAYRIVADRQLAEDIVQECFLSIWRSSGTFDPMRSGFRSWFTTIIRNRSFDHLRSRAIQPKLSPEIDVAAQPAAGDVAGTVAQHLESEQVRSALADLPPEQRETLELAYYGGLTQTEIAARMGVPIGTVKGRVRIAVSKLRQSLAGLAVEQQA